MSALLYMNSKKTLSVCLPDQTLSNAYVIYWQDSVLTISTCLGLWHILNALVGLNGPEFGHDSGSDSTGLWHILDTMVATGSGSQSFLSY